MNKKIILWLDDIRDPKEEMWRNYIAKKIGNPLHFDIIWVKNFTEFTEYILKKDLPDIISFDHDLADEHYTPIRYWDNYDASKEYQESQNYTEKTGKDCANWLVEYCLNNSKPLPIYFVHSANPVGADNIRQLLINFNKKNNK